MQGYRTIREKMVKNQLVGRGIRDRAVLEAMREVPREEFVPADMVEFAYEDTPLPIGEGQTISQPYIVALMIEQLELSSRDRVLEIGTGSGYGAAVLSRIAAEVYTVERYKDLAKAAQERFEQLGLTNIHVLHGDGTLGWPEHAPYTAIIVTAGGPDIPGPLREQLAVGGRMVIPVGPTPRLQELVRVRRISEYEYQEEGLGAVQFVPLIGAAGWEEPEKEGNHELPSVTFRPSVPDLIGKAAEPFWSIVRPDLRGLLDRIGGARVVLLGEASHGTAEFYEMRARITQELITRQGFTIVAVEADWPDAARIDHYVRNIPVISPADKPFSRFPTWMWANTQVLTFIEWLRQYNQTIESPEQSVEFAGLDLYSLYTSIDTVLKYLDSIDPETARVARHRYGCLSPWERNPAAYGAAALSGRYRECEQDVVAMLQDMIRKRLEYAARNGQYFLDVVQNARLIANAERYYRLMYYGSAASWNLRDRHMFETLESLLNYRGPSARTVVWAHNSHIGDASATEMAARGEYNLGQLCRAKFGVYLIGFGTDHGTVAAASDWDGPMEIKNIPPAHPESYEWLCHNSGTEAFLLPLKAASAQMQSRRSRVRGQVREELIRQRLERAVGVIYRPETELESHYFHASLPRQFDEYIWFDETRAVTPLSPDAGKGMPETFPFGV